MYAPEAAISSKTNIWSSKLQSFLTNIHSTRQAAAAAAAVEIAIFFAIFEQGSSQGHAMYTFQKQSISSRRTYSSQ